MVSASSEPQGLPELDQDVSKTTHIIDLPVEVIRGVFQCLDAETIATAVPSVCRMWRDVARDAEVWRGRLSPRLLACAEQLEALGPTVSPAHLHLALTGRNFLRNPGFRRDDNSVILPPLGSLASGGRWPSWSSRWQRTAWVLNTSVGKEVTWELSPEGMDDGAVASAPHPPPPLPYPGAGHLVSRMRRAFMGFLDLMQRGVALADGVGAALAAPPLTAAPTPQQADATVNNGQEIGASHPLQQQQQRQERQGTDEACLATLGTWSEVVQVVDLDWELQRRGLTPAQAAALLDAELGLRLSVHVGARADSEAEYAMALLLDEGDSGGGSGGDDALPSLQAFVARPSRHLGYVEEEHLPPGTWQRFEYELTSVPRGARRATVMLRGRRAPTAAGGAPVTRFCGAKFASAQLVFV